jgi:hypothetical protein
MKKGLLIIVTFLFLIFVGLRWNSASFFSVAEYRCIQTGILADDYFCSIDTVVGNLLKDNFSAHAIIDHIQKQFPVINKTIVSYRPTAVHVAIYGRKPLCCINNSLVLTGEGELFPKNSFSDSAITDIPTITVATPWMTQASTFLLSLLHELPSDFNQHYTLELVNEHYMRLVDKNKPQFTIVSSAAQKEIPTLLAHCEVVKKNIDERKGFDKGIAWIADARFANYVIAYRV